jgi:hypothetical protein
MAWLNDWMESFPEDEDDEADFDVFRSRDDEDQERTGRERRGSGEDR